MEKDKIGYSGFLLGHSMTCLVREQIDLWPFASVVIYTSKLAGN